MLDLLDALQQEKIFVMLVGFPGSGKTTWAMKTFPTYPGQSWRYISSDAYIEGKAQQKGLTYNEVFRQYINEAQDRCFQLTKEGINRNQTIVWDQTNLTRSSRSKKIITIPEDYKKYCVVVQCADPNEWYNRLKSRPGKNIPDNILEVMQKSYEVPELDEGFNGVYEVLT